MTGRRCLLSPEVQAALIEAIEAGAFDWVAAEAAGIGRRTFYDWLRRGESGEQPFADLLTAVRQARAAARVGAERTIRQHNPLAWLRLGPGRERADEPGWTTPNKPASPNAPEGETEKLLREALERVDDG